MRRLGLTFFFLALGAPFAAAQAAPAALRPDAPRPKIALALSGGGANSFLYLGALEWFEQHRIPVDAIAGTSGGALVGGLYSTGFELLTDEEIAQPTTRETPGEMKLGGVERALGIDSTESLFSDSAPYGSLSIPRKRERREFPNELDGPFNPRFVRKQGGYFAGNNIGLFLDRLTQAYPPDFTAAGFDVLPTPFRCVAVDAPSSDPASWSRVVFGRGDALPEAVQPPSLGQALRASIGIPVIFAPLQIPKRDGTTYRLVDGALLDNLPTDVAIDDFRPEVLIAFRYRGMYTGNEETRTAQGRVRVNSDAVKPGSSGYRPGETLSIELDPKGRRADEFDRFREFAWMGYQQMEALHKGSLGAKLDRLMLSAEAYQAYRDARRARRLTGPIVAERVRSLSIPDRALTPLRRELIGKDLRQSGVQSRLIDALEQIFVDRRLGTVGYSVLSDGTLDIRSTPRATSSPEYRTGLTFEAMGGDRVWTGASLRVADLPSDRPGYWAEATIGNEPLARIGAQLPLGRDLFLTSMGRIGREQQFRFDDGERIAGSGISTVEGGLGIDYRPRPRFGLRSAIDFGSNAADGRSGDPITIETGAYTRLSLRADYDTSDAAFVPRRGRRIWSELRHYPTLAGARDLTQLEGGAEAFLSHYGGRDILALRAQAGTSFGGATPFPFEYRLGGFSSFTGYRRDEVRDSGYLSLRAAGFREIGRLPLFLGRVYSVASLETVIADGRARGAFTFGAIADSRFGDAFLGVSLVDRGAVRPLLSLGRRF